MTTGQHGDPGDQHADAVHAHEPGELRHTTHGMEPAVFAARADVVFAPPAPAAEVRARLERFCHALDGELAAAGCTLVGHIKGTLEGAAGDVSFSVTSLRGAARVTTDLSGGLGAAVLTINVIVFGIPGAALRGLVTQAWGSRVAAATSWR